MNDAASDIHKLLFAIHLGDDIKAKQLVSKLSSSLELALRDSNNRSLDKYWDEFIYPFLGIATKTGEFKAVISIIKLIDKSNDMPENIRKTLDKFKLLVGYNEYHGI